MKALVRIAVSGEDDSLGKVHIARECDLAPCCGIHARAAGHWQQDIAATPNCERCLRIYARFVGNFTATLPGL